MVSIYRARGADLVTPNMAVNIMLQKTRPIPLLYSSLVGFWKMDEASGTRADSIGANTLVDNNTVTATTGKVYANAGSFNGGNSEYLSLADNAPLSTGDVSFWMAAWVYLIAGSATSMAFFSKDALTTNREYRLFANRNGSDDFRPTMLVMNNNSSNAQAVWGSSMGMDAYRFVIGWHDATANLVGVSVDNGTAVTTSYSGGAADSTAPFEIGRLQETSNLYMNGRIGPAMMGKNYVPTATDRTFLWNGGAGITLAQMAYQ